MKNEGFDKGACGHSADAARPPAAAVWRRRSKPHQNLLGNSRECLYDELPKAHDTFYPGFLESQSASLTCGKSKLSNWKKFLPETGECLILDAGGDGELAIEAAHLGHRVFLLNESQEAVNSAGGKIRDAGLSNRIIPAQGELDDIKFPEGTFDFVVGESVPSKKAASELFRVAKKGAPIIIGPKKYDK